MNIEIRGSDFNKYCAAFLQNQVSGGTNRVVTLKFYILVIIFLGFLPCVLTAEDNSKVSKKTSTQQVGGLLFDVDEGAKIEQGPGGSIYVKSNKEYMQQKFSDIESKLTELDARTAELENKLKLLGSSDGKVSSEKSSPENSDRQVLIS